MTTQQALVPDMVSLALLPTLPNERLAVLRKQIAPGASDAELEHFLISAEHNGLDGFAVPTQIACFPSRIQVNGQWTQKYVPVVMVDGWRKKLMDTGKVEDIEIEYCGEDEIWRDVWSGAGGKRLVACRASIWLIGRTRPIRFVAYLEEFIRFKAGSNEPIDTWKRPRHMLAVKAIVHCAKQALIAIGSLFTRDLLADPDEDGEQIGDSRGNAQRRFWATGWDDATVRRTLQIGEDEDLSEAIQRFGGYARLEAHMERVGATVASLPAPTGITAAEALYGEDQHRDPAAAARPAARTASAATSRGPEPIEGTAVARPDTDAPETAPGAIAGLAEDTGPELFTCSNCGRRTDEVRARDGAGPVCKYCWEEAQDKAAAEPDTKADTKADIDPTAPMTLGDALSPGGDIRAAMTSGDARRTEATGVDLDNIDPPATQHTEVDAETGEITGPPLCGQCGAEATPDLDVDGDPVCHTCFDEARLQSQYPTTPRPPKVVDLLSFSVAARELPDGGMSRSELQAVLKRYEAKYCSGRPLAWKSLPVGELDRRWRFIQLPEGAEA